MSNLDNAQPDQKTFWLQFENYLSRERMKEKYNSLIKNAIYQTDLESKMQFYANNQFADFNYIGLMNNTISDSTIQLTDQDYSNYINAHKDDYKRDVSRGIEFVTFDINVRKEDTLFAQDYINKQSELLKNARNDSGFVARRGYASNGYVAKGAMKEVPETMVDQIWAADSGMVFGPTLENGVYRTIKVGGSKKDSQFVYKASHILLRPAGLAKEDSTNAMKDAQEILKRVKGGEDFAVIAKEKSQDPGSATKGGDLGWFPLKQMVPEFGKAIENAKYGDVVTCKSQFGIHVIKITGQKSNLARRIAILEKKIESGSESEKLAYNAASKFSASLTVPDSFNKAVQKDGLNKRIVNEVKPNDKTVSGLQSSREVVRWMFDKSTKIGAISAPISVGNQWVVAKLVKIQEQGLASVEDVKEQIKPLIISEKKKDVLLKKLEEAVAKSGTNMEAISKELKTPVLLASNTIIMNPNLPSAGNEPMVVGYASGMKVNAVSKPIKGNDGVFIIKLLKKASVEAPKNYDAERKNSASMVAGRFTNEVTNILKEQAKVRDNRYLYY
jgi:peptidyl-prolyl cis-trans isomerase D